MEAWAFLQTNINWIQEKDYIKQKQEHNLREKCYEFFRFWFWFHNISSLMHGFADDNVSIFNLLYNTNVKQTTILIVFFFVTSFIERNWEKIGPKVDGYWP